MIFSVISGFSQPLIILFIYFWLCCVFIAACVFPQLQQVGATLQLKFMNFPSWWLLLLWSTGSGVLGLQQMWHVGSVVVSLQLQSTGSEVVVHGLSCPAACGTFPQQRRNPRLLHWQTDSLPLSHQGSPVIIF